MDTKKVAYRDKFEGFLITFCDARYGAIDIKRKKSRL